jgi:hypothetical protein
MTETSPDGTTEVHRNGKSLGLDNRACALLTSEITKCGGPRVFDDAAMARY